MARGDGTDKQRRSWSRVLTADAAAPQELLDALWNDADRLVSSGTMLKDGDRCTLVVTESAGRRVVVKRFNRRGPVHGLLHVLLRSRARWCWVNAQRVAALGLATPKPMAMLETRAGPLRDRSVFVCEHIAGRTLVDVAGDPQTPASQLERLADAFAAIWSRLGGARLGHRDMKATNFIVDDDDRLWMVDLDAMRRYPPGTSFARRRRKDLSRFMMNWRGQPAAAVFRERLDQGERPAGERSSAG